MGSRAHDHVLYVGGDHLLRLRGLRDAAGIWQDNATLEVTVLDSDGNEVTGQTWPVTMSSIYGTASITALDSADNSITVSGDHTDEIMPGDRVEIVGSTGNDGVYHVADKDDELTVELSGGDTVVTLEESLPDSTADGTLEWGHGSYHAILEDSLELSVGKIYEVKVDADAGSDVKGDFYLYVQAEKNYI